MKPFESTAIALGVAVSRHRATEATSTVNVPDRRRHRMPIDQLLNDSVVQTLGRRGQTG
jgi:hypothetical protein